MCRFFIFIVPSQIIFNYFCRIFSILSYCVWILRIFDVFYLSTFGDILIVLSLFQAKYCNFNSIFCILLGGIVSTNRTFYFKWRWFLHVLKEAKLLRKSIIIKSSGAKIGAKFVIYENIWFPTPSYSKKMQNITKTWFLAPKTSLFYI